MDLKRNELGRTEISEYTPPPMNSVVTALPGLVPIFDSAGGVNALAGVLFVPKIRKNLLPVPAMAQMQAEVRFDEEKCYIIKNGKKIDIGHLNECQLFVMNTQPDYVNVTTTKAPSLKQWHCRYIWSPELWIQQ